MAERITLRMLLTHSAGLPTDVDERGSRDPEGLERFLRTELKRYPLVAPPGLLFRYSNLGFSLLGHVAEVVAGVPYPELMRSLVFGPLGMERTTLDPTMAMSYPLAQSHRLVGNELQVVRPFADNTAFSPAGFAFSTVLDLANLARMLLAGGQWAGEECLGLPTAGWEPAVIQPDRGEWSRCTGTYLSDSEGFARVFAQGDRLQVNRNGEEHVLTRHAPGHYVAQLQQGGWLGAGFVSDGEYLLLGEKLYRRIHLLSEELHPEWWVR